MEIQRLSIVLDTPVVETNKVCSPALPHSPGMEQPLTCALWGLAEGSPTSTHTTTQGFSDVFGLVLQTDISDTEILQHYLGVSSAASSLPTVPPSDLVSFPGQARHLPVSLSPTCLSTLKNYFVVSRRHRQGCKMAQSALKTLLCLAKCHARLALRSMAGEVDAVFACYILEQNLMIQTGYSPIGLRPATQAVIGSLQEFLEDNDSRMLHFKARLRKFLSEESDILSSDLGEPVIRRSIHKMHTSCVNMKNGCGLPSYRQLPEKVNIKDSGILLSPRSKGEAKRLSRGS